MELEIPSVIEPDTEYGIDLSKEEDRKFLLDHKKWSNLGTVPTEDEDQHLERTIIAAGGAVHPLIVWVEQNVLIDGYRRLKCCIKNKLPYQVKYLNFASEDDAMQFVYENELGRRSLPPAAYKLLVGKLAELLTKKNASTTVKAEKINVVDEVVKKTGVSVNEAKRQKAISSALALLPNQVKAFYESVAKTPGSQKKFTENELLALTQISHGSAIEAVNAYRKGKRNSMQRAIEDQFVIAFGEGYSKYKPVSIEGVPPYLIETALNAMKLVEKKKKSKSAPTNATADSTLDVPEDINGSGEGADKLSAASASTAAVDKTTPVVESPKAPESVLPKSTKSVTTLVALDAAIEAMIKDLAKALDRRADATGQGNTNYKQATSAIRSLSLSFERWKESTASIPQVSSV